MDVIISIDVRRTIDEYANALMYYPITRNRARQKVDNLTAALEALGSSIVTPAICMSKDLLQTFDAGETLGSRILDVSITGTKVDLHGHLLACMIMLMILSLS